MIYVILLIHYLRSRGADIPSGPVFQSRLISTCLPSTQMHANGPKLDIEAYVILMVFFPIVGIGAAQEFIFGDSG